VSAHAVVLLHGLLGSARNLSTLARSLAEREPAGTVVALDLLGHGSAAPLPAGADSRALAADVLATARARGLAAPLALVGHSLGGRAALHAAMLSPEAVASVTLLDIPPGPLPRDDGVAAVVDVMRQAPATVRSRGEARDLFVKAGVPAGVAQWLVLNLEPSGSVYRWRVDREALAALHARIAAEDLWPAVEGRRAYDVRCIRGAASTYVSEEDAQRLERAGCPVTTIEGTDHFLHAERPAEVASAILEGLR
jgi:esterase